jgi:hypothetical protein
MRGVVTLWSVPVVYLKCELTDTTTGTGNELFFFQFPGDSAGRVFRPSRL